MARAARWTRRTVLAWSAGVLGGVLVPSAAAAKRKPKPSPGVYSNVYSNIY